MTDVVREWMRKQRAVRNKPPPPPQKRESTAEEEGQHHQQQLMVKTDQVWMRETLSLEPDTENVSVPKPDKR